MSRKRKSTFRYIVKAEELSIDGRSFGIYMREAWGRTKHEAIQNYPLRHGKIVVRGVRQVGGKNGVLR